MGIAVHVADLLEFSGMLSWKKVSGTDLRFSCTFLLEHRGSFIN